MPVEVVIREMRIEDIEAVMDLEREIFPSPWSPSFFRHELRRGDHTVYLVAEAGGRLVGFIGANLMDEEIHLTNMAVALDVRRRGLGSVLLVECVRYGLARGARWLTLEVRKGNWGAREFYRLFGFRELGARRDYYVDSGEDAVMMATGDIREKEFEELLAGRGGALLLEDGDD